MLLIYNFKTVFLDCKFTKKINMLSFFFISLVRFYCKLLFFSDYRQSVTQRQYNLFDA